MTDSAARDPGLDALSPVDGRYAARVKDLRGYFSEAALIRHRVRVEAEWFRFLAEDLRLPELADVPPAVLSTAARLAVQAGSGEAETVKRTESSINHDVKAVEYWIKEQCNAPSLDADARAELARVSEFVHFACTSEDINNTSHALQLQAARDHVVLPALDGLVERFRSLAHRYAEVPMLSRTHGQTASPTTVGKEMANIAVRLQKARQHIAAVDMLAKMNGAVGNYNAHLSAWPEVDWEAFSRQVVEAPAGTEIGRAHV